MALHAAAVTDLRIVLYGKTGVGKSSAGNTILGSDRFPTEPGSSSVTKDCQTLSTTAGGRRVGVTDTPDFFYSTYGEDLGSEIERSVTLCSPGVHAFLFILKPSTFTQQEADMVLLFEQSYGEEAFNHTVILFTHGDQVDNTQILTLISQNQMLEDLVNRCGGRVHLLNNKDPENRQQVTELLQKIDSMVSANGNRCYTLEMLREAESRAEQQRGRILEEQRREREREEREHQMTLQRVKRETEERVRREEMEKRAGEEELRIKSTDRRNTDKLQNYWKICAVLMRYPLKPMPTLILNVLVVGAMGVVYTHIGPAQAKTFLRGCLIGLSLELGGAVTGRLCSCIICRALELSMSTKECPRFREPTMRAVSILCGVVFGSSVMYVKGPGGALPTLLGGVAGGLLIWQRNISLNISK